MRRVCGVRIGDGDGDDTWCQLKLFNLGGKPANKEGRMNRRWMDRWMIVCKCGKASIRERMELAYCCSVRIPSYLHTV